MNTRSPGLERRKDSAQCRVRLTESYRAGRNWPEVECGWALKSGTLF